MVQDVAQEHNVVIRAQVVNEDVPGPVGDHIIETCCVAQLLSLLDGLWEVKNF